MDATATLDTVLCVACGQSDRQLKIIACLHTLCIECVEDNLNHDSSLVCPACGTTTEKPAPGKQMVLCLPNAHFQDQAHYSSKTNTRPVHCDDCAAENIAVASCDQCATNLCETHAAAHSLFRATNGHTLTRFNVRYADTSSTPESAHCPIHTSKPIQSYCSQCHELLCKRCLQGSQHQQQHNDSVQEVPQAAAIIRQNLDVNVTDTLSPHSGTLPNAIQQTQHAIQQLNDDTIHISDQIQQFFDNLRDNLSDREKDLRNQLDNLRLKLVLPLEKQLNTFQEAMRKGQTAAAILQACNVDIDLLRMWQWIDQAQKVSAQITKSMQSGALGNLVFTPTNGQELQDLITRTGSVHDDGPDPDNSTLKCDDTDRIYLKQDIKITLDVQNYVSCPVSKDILEHTNVNIQINTPDQTTATCEPVVTSQPGQLQALYKPVVTGKHIVTASLQGKQLAGSPATVDVLKAPVGFDPDRCHADQKLSNAMCTVRHDGTDGNCGSVCDAERFTSGQASVDIQLDVLPYPGPHLFICACKSDQPPLQGWCENKQENFGWYGNSAHSYISGTKLGQPWAAGDVITLTLDLDKHTLTGHHHRSGKTQVLNIGRGQFYWYVSMIHLNQQVSIV